MIDRKSDFFRMSKEITEEFLQSTVIIDDFLFPKYLSSGDRTLDAPTPSSRPPIGDKKQIPQAETLLPRQASEDINTEIDLSSNPAFDYRVVIGAFAKKRIVCSVINPRETERDDLPELIRHLADCADIVVIDWSLHNDNGEKAMEILASILRQDETPAPGRLRLLAIYTVNPHIDRIPIDIKEHLAKELSIQAEEDSDGFALSYGATRIVILAKPERTKIQPEFHDRIVEFNQLPDRLTDEFTTMTAGLVSNVVVSAFSRIRKNTYRVLSRFSDNLDSPYLSHRFMSPEPHDAESHISALVAAELQALLEEAKIGRNAGIDAIRAWLDAISFPGFTLGYASHKQQAFSLEDVLLVLDNGLGNFNKLSNKDRNRLDEELHTKQMTLHFSNGSEDASALDERFAAISLMRSHYDETVPVLTLGTIIKDVSGDNPSYFVCVQPRCDCVRLSSKRSFPFLPLIPDKSWFDTVLPDDGQHIRLRVMRKPHQIKLLCFAPRATENGVIVARKEEGQFSFEDVEQHRYQWMGDLRGEHALRLSNEFASTVGRVGLDESEWLRRWAAKR